MTKAGDAGKDFIGGLGPDEGLRGLVGDAQVVLDGRLQLPGAAMDPAAQLLFGQRGKPTLHQVEP